MFDHFSVIEFESYLLEVAVASYHQVNSLEIEFSMHVECRSTLHFHSGLSIYATLLLRNVDASAIAVLREVYHKQLFK
jgi:hypothetical protein